MTTIEVHYDSEDTGGSGEWAAVYVEGKLDRVGDSYLGVERVFELLGVKVVDDSAFMRGQHQREGVAQNLNEVENYRAAREDRIERANQLRIQADGLRKRADRIEQEVAHG